MKAYINILTIHDSKLDSNLIKEVIKKLEELDWDLIVNDNQYDETEICIPIDKINELYFK